MRHGRKSRSTLIDSYKRHILSDMDTDPIAAVGITSANVAEAEVIDDIAADQTAQHTRLVELHIDRAYLPSRMASGKNLFDLRRTAVVHNLHVIARTGKLDAA